MGDYLGQTTLTYALGKIKTWAEGKFLTSSSLKTINGESVVGSGDIAISGGTPTLISANGTKSSMSTGTSMQTISDTLTLGKGTWIILASARFPSLNARAGIQIYCDPSASGTLTGQGVAKVTDYSNSTLELEAITIVEFSSDSGTTQLKGWQNKSSTVNVTWYVRAVKLG